MAKHIFQGKPIVLRLLKGPELRTTSERIDKREKIPAPCRIQTQDLSVTRCALNRCATTTAKLQKFLVVLPQDLYRLGWICAYVIIVVCDINVMQS